MTTPTDDIDRIMAVMSVAFDPAFGEAWNRRQVEDALLIGNCHYFLVNAAGKPAMTGEQAVGFSLSRTGFEEEELLLFAVNPECRRKGIGQIIIGDLLSAARSRGAKRLLLEMRRDNPAESLYRSNGFSPIGTRSDYYRQTDGRCIDAITFECPIA
ncbi:MAG: GNAT family N-acetyltransferase [Novosphingobium sp.]|nr:GNAT family N-acetyltransferase [Novosphingobium sp.]